MQKLFDQTIAENLSPAAIATHFVRKAFRERGIKLTKKQLSALRARLDESLEHLSSLNFELTKKQLLALGPEERATNHIALAVPDDAQDFVEHISDKLETIMLSSIAQFSDILYKDLRRDAPAQLRYRHKVRKGFEARLSRRWKKPFELLEILLEIATEAGASCVRTILEKNEQHPRHVVEVVKRLHARACLIASEIVALMRSGHADGAIARWRSLHEVSVIAFFIAHRGEVVAERYLDHRHIDSYRAAVQYEQYRARLGFEPFEKEEFISLQQTRDALLRKWGAPFREAHGWAAEVLGNNNPHFAHIEADVGLDYFRPFLRIAGHSVHAEPKGAFFRMGLVADANILLAGPSNTGFTDAAQCAALSLTQVTTALLTIVPNIDRLVTCRVMASFAAEVGPAFMQVQDEIEAEEKALQAGTPDVSKP